jgi:hypothetical protein
MDTKILGTRPLWSLHGQTCVLDLQTHCETTELPTMILHEAGIILSVRTFLFNFVTASHDVLIIATQISNGQFKQNFSNRTDKTILFLFFPIVSAICVIE